MTGLVGLGFGRWVLELELLAGAGAQHVDVRAVCDTDPRRLADLRAHHDLRTHDDLDALLADPEIEAVALFTGPVGRADLVRRIVDAGRAVLTTKPFERDADAARAALEDAARRGAVVHCNSPGPELPPDVARIVEWRDGLALGRPVGARWDTWCSYREQADGSWYDDPDACPVAPLFRIGVYGINELVTLLGVPADVQVSTSRVRTGRPTPDQTAALLRWHDGVVATVSASFCVDDGVPYPDELTLRYERATIRRRAIATTDGGRRVALSITSPEVDGGEQVVELPRVESAPYRWDLLHAAIRRPGSVPGVPAIDVVVGGIRTVDALARAERSGRTEPV